MRIIAGMPENKNVFRTGFVLGGAKLHFIQKTEGQIWKNLLHEHHQISN